MTIRKRVLELETYKVLDASQEGNPFSRRVIVYKILLYVLYRNIRLDMRNSEAITINGVYDASALLQLSKFGLNFENVWSLLLI